jgi:hypothetical protein
MLKNKQNKTLERVIGRDAKKTTQETIEQRE